MSKLYIFAIGGTGTRVLRSFTYLLASGVTLKNYDEVVPYIIDPDLRCGNTTDTISLLEEYKNIRKSAYFKDIEQKYAQKPDYEYFFKTKITNMCSNGHFVMDVPGAGTAQKFKDYMCFNDSSYTSNDKALVQLLFSKENLEAMMDVGFKGNPNLGSVVMNTIDDSDDFRKFAGDFKDNDGVFVIGSIFGGTGASGIPLLIRKMRNSNNTNLKKDPCIGAITVMPYFEAEGFKEDDADNKLDTTTFFQKTQAALKYYKDSLTKTKDNIPYIDHHYYIGDPMQQKNKNSDGGENQRNDSCLAELISALSIFHFAKQSRNEDDDEPRNTIYHEYSLIAGEKEDEFDFSSLEESKFIKKSMTKFLMLENFAKQFMPKIDYKKPWSKKYKQFTDNEKINKICSFLDGYKQWLKELASENSKSPKTGRKFTPFNFKTDEKHVFELIKNTVPRKPGLFSDKNYDLFEQRLNDNNSISDIFDGENPDSWFINLFSVVTEELYNSEIEKIK